MTVINYMDDKLYEAARSNGSRIPAPLDDNDEHYYLRVTPGDGSNALHVAAKHGNHSFIESILTLWVDPAQILCSHNSKGETPLHLAAQSGSVETVELILSAHGEKSGCCWRERDKRRGETPLHVALGFGHDQTAMLMLQKDMEYLVGLHNHEGASLAYVAAKNFCLEFLRKILDADRQGKCCVSFSGPFGQTAFHPARRLPEDILAISIERRKDLLRVQDNENKTALHYAVEEGRDQVVEMLLKANKDLAYLRDNDGMPPLHIAARKGLLHIVQTILTLCPQSITICDKDRGQTALHVVNMDGHSLEKCLKNTRMKELINEVDNDGNTPLHLALMNTDLATADKLLLVDGINWRLANKLGYTPLDLCISDDQIPLRLRLPAGECRSNEVLKMDVFFHKNVVNTDDVLDHFNWVDCLNFKGPQGDNIFHIAARDGSLKIVSRVYESDSARALLISGQNSKGETPLHLASEYGRLGVVQYILTLTKSETNGNNPSTVVAIENRGSSLMSFNPIGDHVKPWRIKSANGDTPAHKAIRNRHTEVALLLLQRDPELILVNNDAKESLFYLAADNYCTPIIEWIFKTDIAYDDSITSGRSGQNFFHAAGRCPRHCHKFYKSLVRKQPHLIRKVDDYGKTPLHYAIEKGKKRTTKWLLREDKSAAFVYDNEGFTPLLRAAVSGRSGCVHWILTLCPQSAKLRELRYNRTVLHLAKMPSLLFFQNCMSHDVMKQIVNETDKDGNTALHCAILDGDIDKALVMLETQGINWTIRNNQQQSPSDLCKELSITGETKQRPISIALRSLSTGEGMNLRLRGLGSVIKAMLLTYNNMITTDDNLKKMLDNIVVAAALLVTITFAAAFTIPGGYDQTTGEAMLMKNVSVQFFIASDVLAMLMAISILIWYTLGGRRTNLRKLAMDCIIMLLISLMATIISFVSGVFAIGCHVKLVVIVPTLIVALLNLFFVFRFEYFEFHY